MTCIYKMILNNEPNRCNLDKELCEEEEGEVCKDRVSELQQELRDWREGLEKDLKEIENGYSTKES